PGRHGDGEASHALRDAWSGLLLQLCSLLRLTYKIIGSSSGLNLTCGGTPRMPSLNWIDLLFLVTILFLVFNGFRNGAVTSLLNLLSIPLGFAVAYVFGPQFTMALASNNLNIAPFLAYIILFFATVIVVHIVATVIRGFVSKIPGVGFGDQLLGAFLGFIEAWLLWVVLLIVVHNVLTSAQNVPGINATQFVQLQQAYNQTISDSLFARVNSFIVPHLPGH
ncbi:MAG: CvpA family protein, partial [Chloroflexota bacterium]|nr:CvpA family protein [Chloroflexota bacterium]